MKTLLLLLLGLMLLSPIVAYSATQKEITNAINNEINPDLNDNAIKAIDSTVGNWTFIDTYVIGFKPNSTELNNLLVSTFSNVAYIPIVINGTVVNVTEPEPPKQEICGNGIDDDNDGLVDEGCPITPPVIPDQPIKDVNASQWLRTCAVGDIDDNNGLVTQINVAQDYNCQIFIMPGDYCYNSCTGVTDKLANSGFDKNNTALIRGNHDGASSVKAFTGMPLTYGTFNLNDKLGIFGIDANVAFDCNSVQFNAIKDQISSSDAWYNLAVIHQPFVTVKSDHSPNGQFACYDPLFRGNGIDAVLQAHNHNYQRFDINGLEYLVVGTGTHDTGSSMYPIDSDNWNGFQCLECNTGTNGITLMDFKIDDPTDRLAFGWFLSNNGDVKDKFTLRD